MERMTKKTAQVFNGFLNLDEIEKIEFFKEVEKYMHTNTTYEKREIERLFEDYNTFKRVHLGPLGDACSCCGK
ncbi:MAG: hypothetical protein KTR26_01455 [Flammeovirgaceae bacterium]|nr:hypothetical protein [Flammeovirgaceae bacterium]